MISPWQPVHVRVQRALLVYLGKGCEKMNSVDLLPARCGSMEILLTAAHSWPALNDMHALLNQLQIKTDAAHKSTYFCSFVPGSLREQ